jgi:sialic acid synthase SpsE
MRRPFLAAGSGVGPGHPTYRIADAAAHHGGDVQLGYKLIETAGASGANAIVFDAPYPGGPLSERDFKSLLGHALYVGLPAFGTAADERQVAFLASLDVPALVVRRLDSDGLLRAAAATGKPLFVRTEGPEEPGASDAALERLCVEAGSAEAVVLRRRDPDALIDGEGHVIMSRHTLESSRPSSTAGVLRKGTERA